jgi:hypothetical protein
VSEQQMQQAIRLALSRGDTRLWRNNSGTLYDRNGRPVQFGLCKGSADLIGLRSITIGPEHVGQRLAVFAAVEVKSATGRATHEQLAFIDVVQQMGGFAGVARSVGEAAALMRIPL